ncbi:hypothetical protein CI109_102394 [Kwoniella shandongensis]|uniref:Uncharacterized protein n=1 Tax=Kwoniella shandongensis TaxID=1734106 RepID=A0A5M6BZS9_9TREE|nr:uncharacterized protein CI109_003286 [Kwoniella shandongensis]KAA5528386.1 hypothetical protein CI109_003286 [Kwoniella shandongensis]
MPSRWTSGLATPNLFASSSQPSSAANSRPSSRASSPTRGNRPSNLVLPTRRREGTVDSTGTDPLGDYFGQTPTTPAYDLGSSMNSPTPWGAMGTPGAVTPGGTGHHHGSTLEVILDSDHLVLRGQGGDMNPAYLSGRVELNLMEKANIKEITMQMTGKAKVQFSEGSGAASKNHHFSHAVTSHDWSFLQGDRGHSHTLKAGYHSFPFSFMLDGNLPSSLKTYAGDATISYKLRAVVVRSGFASNFSAQKDFTLIRMFTPEALEFNQTLEIENTWPGKVMYALTLPFKAYAAGDDIPVNVKFMPLAKGVKVTAVTSVLKEYTLVHTRHSSHPETRVAACVKHELHDGRAVEVAREPIRAPQHWIESHGNRSTPASRHSSPSQTPMIGGRGRLPATTFNARPSDSYFPGPPVDGEAGGADTTAQAGSSSAPDQAPATEINEEDIDIGDEEINTHFSIPIPSWVTPSHSIHPVFITHKLKWSCSISNPDGHVSELRCALPILILDHSLLDEARAAGASTRGLLFGHTAEEPQIDLPSYSNHVYDRIAIADSGNATGFVPRSVNATPLPSPHDDTPPRSRAPSRPSSPVRGYSHASGTSASSRSNEPTPAGDVPPRRQLPNFVDSELLLSLGSLRTQSAGSSPNGTPPDSRGPSRPLSRRNSRSGRSSRAGSRASSPERGNSQSSSLAGSYADESHVRPGTERRSTGLHSLFHLPKPMRPLSHLPGGKTILRNGSNVNLHQAVEGLPRNSSVPGALHSAAASIAGGNSSASSQNHVSFAPRVTALEPRSGGGAGANGRTSFQIGGDDDDQPYDHGGNDGEGHDDEEEVDPLSQVPSYAIASRGFLGGGVVPIDAGLPTYDASERLMERTRSSTDLTGDSTSLLRPRSDTALVQLGAAAAAEAEERATEEA